MTLCEFIPQWSTEHIVVPSQFINLLLSRQYAVVIKPKDNYDNLQQGLSV